MIKFNETTSLTVVTDFDEENDNITGESYDTFVGGELVDAEIINETVEKGEKFVDLQFCDGSVAFGVLRESFVVVN